MIHQLMRWQQLTSRPTPQNECELMLLVFVLMTTISGEKSRQHHQAPSPNHQGHPLHENPRLRNSRSISNLGTLLCFRRKERTRDRKNWCRNGVRQASHNPPKGPPSCVQYDGAAWPRGSDAADRAVRENEDLTHTHSKKKENWPANLYGWGRAVYPNLCKLYTCRKTQNTKDCRKKPANVQKTGDVFVCPYRQNKQPHAKANASLHEKKGAERTRQLSVLPF